MPRCRSSWGSSSFRCSALAGVLTPKVLVIALLIGCVGFPCTFLAKLIVERMPVHVHTAMLDAVVIIGGSGDDFGALR